MKDQVNKNYKNEIDIVYYSGFFNYKREMGNLVDCNLASIKTLVSLCTWRD